MEGQTIEEKNVRLRVWINIPERTWKKLRIKAIEEEVSQEVLISAIIRAEFEQNDDRN